MVATNSGVTVCSSRDKTGQITGTPSELNSMACPVEPTVTSAMEWNNVSRLNKIVTAPMASCCVSSRIGAATTTTWVPKLGSNVISLTYTCGVLAFPIACHQADLP